MSGTDGDGDERGGEDRVGISIGSMSGGAIATGSHGRATSVTHHNGPDPAQQQLLDAVRRLRGELAERDRTGEDTALDDELARVEGEITSGGAADRGRLGPLLGRLAAYGPAAATAASVTAVIQAIAQVMG
ncbi:hypothetical protein [Streptomyces minutiscleroticus]|uniref:Uncharacterized protein n=1 Tax=Streptomyces minutiscleroticus TaxID=68238 RepID=A0A918KKW5_9ACTN|nr:hypothetical protein [Streptomyces minutiscleroticus]GGX67683.1 hypothetical protein GCM10010358_22600 [Streptomyces minutiscleroticus]